MSFQPGRKKGDMRKVVSCPPRVKRGPEKGFTRWSTRLACLYRKLVRSRPEKAIPIDCRALAKQLGCSYETVVRLTGDFANGTRRTVWTFQGYGFVVFLRYRRHAFKRCGHPRFYVINRYGLHRIGGRPRARLRRKTRELWMSHLALLKKLAFGLLIRGRERAIDKHKGSPSRETGGAPRGRSPPTANRGGLRRFNRIAARLQMRFDTLKGATRTDLHGWLLNRLAEWHSEARILGALGHAVTVYRKREGLLRHANPSAWICAVASRHLDGDGLGKVQRWRDLHPIEKAPARAGALNEGAKTGGIVMDNDGLKWQHFGGTDWRPIE